MRRSPPAHEHRVQAGPRRAREGESERRARELAAELDDRRLPIRASYESAQLRMWFDGDDRRGGSRICATRWRSRRSSTTARSGSRVTCGSAARCSTWAISPRRTSSSCAASRSPSDMGSHRDEARATSILGFIRSYRGEIAEAEELALRALELARADRGRAPRAAEPSSAGEIRAGAWRLGARGDAAATGATACARDRRLARDGDLPAPDRGRRAPAAARRGPPARRGGSLGPARGGRDRARRPPNGRG